MTANLLEVIKTTPDDELAWIALADWLEELGQSGPAELHRLGVVLRRARDAPDRFDLEERLRGLIGAGVRPVVPTHSIALGEGVPALAFALVPPGTFSMGSPDTEPLRDSDEGPVHRVTLTRGFYLGIYPVTQAQWETVMGSNPSHFLGPNRPVESISWDDCQEFCRQLRDRSQSGVRLPSEAEWEYACRAGTTTPFPFGESISADLANYKADVIYQTGQAGVYRMETTPVGEFLPNPWGLHDVVGNVWEWCQDCYESGYYERSPLRDPLGPSTGTARVVRGGSWRGVPRTCRAAYRERGGAEYRDINRGVRLAISL